MYKVLLTSLEAREKKGERKMEIITNVPWVMPVVDSALLVLAIVVMTAGLFFGTLAYLRDE